MAEYIEREKAIAEIKNYALEAYDIDLDDSKQFAGNSTGEKYCEGLYEATEILEEVPSADVVKVVRCKDCKHYEETGIGEFDIPLGICKVHKILFDDEPIEVNETDFCSYGVLKECMNNA